MARRSKAELFGDDAPVWRFLKALSAILDPEECRIANSGLFVIEVLPALALPAFNEKFYGYRKGPKYNPANRSQFRQVDWCAVIETIAAIARAVPIEGLEDWTRQTTKIEAPRKSHQDQIDAVLCALIGHHWRTKPREHSIMIGDLTSGYIVSPASAPITERLNIKALKISSRHY